MSFRPRLVRLALGLCACLSPLAPSRADRQAPEPGTAPPAAPIVAECDEPRGYTIGQDGADAIDTRDAMTGGHFTFRINVAEHHAAIIGEDARGHRLTTEAVLMIDRPGAISLVEDNPTGAVWLYTLYPRAGRALLTRHWGAAASANGPEGAIGTLLQATCTFTGVP